MQQYEISKEYITNAFMNYTNIQTQQRISIYLYYFGHAQNITQLQSNRSSSLDFMTIYFHPTSSDVNNKLSNAGFAFHKLLIIAFS